MRATILIATLLAIVACGPESATYVDCEAWESGAEQSAEENKAQFDECMSLCGELEDDAPIGEACSHLSCSYACQADSAWLKHEHWERGRTCTPYAASFSGQAECAARIYDEAMDSPGEPCDATQPVPGLDGC